MPRFNIEASFAPGDALYYIMTEAENCPGPPLVQIKCDSHGIWAIQIDTEKNVRIVHELSDTPELPGGRNTCLDHESAFRYLTEHFRDSVYLDGRTVKALFMSGEGVSQTVDLAMDIATLDEHIRGRITTSEPDAYGTIAIYDGSADKSNSEFVTFVRDANGNPVDTIYGPFLLIGTRPDPETGLRMPADIPENISGARPISQDPPSEFDPDYWCKGSRMTVRMLMEYLQSLPDDAVLHCCGTDIAYLHYSPGTKALSIDCEGLEDLPEYEDREPAVLAGPGR